jgi:hypothetical protein
MGRLRRDGYVYAQNDGVACGGKDMPFIRTDQNCRFGIWWVSGPTAAAKSVPSHGPDRQVGPFQWQGAVEHTEIRPCPSLLEVGCR